MIGKDAYQSLEARTFAPNLWWGPEAAQAMTMLNEVPRQENEMTPVKIIAFLTAAITTLLSIGLVLIGVIYSSLRSDIDDLKKSSTEMTKTIASVDKQAAVTNQKLDDILQELKRPRR
jgi:hypothetical protein